MNSQIILSLLLLLLAAQPQYLGAQETISFSCTSQNKAFLFKTMQTFSIVSLTKEDGVVLSSNKTTCTFEKLHNHICTFENMTHQVNISCPGVAFETPKHLELLVSRAQILAHEETSHEDTKLVQLQLGSGEQGIVSILLTYNIVAEMNKLHLSTNQNAFDLFLISECVDDIVLFGDRFKIAVKKKAHACVIGLKEFTSDWKFFKTVTEFTDKNSVYSGYLEKTVSKQYTLNDKSIDLYMVIESQQIQQLKGLAIQVQLVSNNGNKTFNITNYQPGLPVFDAYIYLDQPYSSLTLKSNYNIFYSLYQLQNSDNIALITEDSYLYTEINDRRDNSFVIELAGFTQQKKMFRVVLLATSSNHTFNFTYQECFTPSCHNSSKQSEVITSGQFTPECNHLIEEMCYVKIKLVNPINGIMGILPLTYSQHVQFKMDIVHQGVLKRQNILHFYVKRSDMLNVASQVLTIGMTGAKVYLTYNPQCKKIHCAEYWGVGNTLQIPREKKDLFIFVEGSMHSHYTLLIDTRNGNAVRIPESVGINHFLSPKQQLRYYLYKPTDSSKSFQINCNAPPNTLLLMVNVRSKTFPSKGNAAFTSKDCYIHINPSEYSSEDMIYITLQRVHDSQTRINFGLLGVTAGNHILGHWREPFHDYFQPNSSKIFKYLISNPLLEIYLKIDMYEQISMSPLSVIFGDQKVIRFSVYVNDTTTFAIDYQKQTKICSSQTQKQCYLFVEINNPSNVGLEVSITLWEKMEPIKLVLGQYENFETGALGEQTHFYLPVENPTKPINIYIFSNQVEIEVIGQLWNPREAVGPMITWPFPLFENLANQTLQGLVYSLSASLYFGKQLLKNANNNSIILITVRDKTKTHNKSEEQLSANLGNIQLVASNGFSILREDDKFEYIINNDEAYHFQFPLGNLLSLDREQVYFYNLALSGTSHLAYYFSSEHFNESSLNFTSEQMLIVKLDDFKQTIRNERQTDHSITFVVRCVGGASCKFIASVVSSSSEYRQLTLGVPEQFYIPPHETAIFQFNDYYNEDFKIKVQREEGFPEYKIKSCIGVKKIDCVAPLLKKEKVEDQSPLILTGRSHELKIDTTSPYYCKGCTYYIVFYAFSQPIYGALTVTRSGQAVILKESVPLTTELYSDNQDSYLISTVPDSERFVTIIPHMGRINIQLVEMLQTNNQKKPRIHTENSSGKANIFLELEKTTVSVPYNLKLRSLDNENVMYTIVLSSKNSLVSLEDGVPFKVTLQPNSNLKVEYQPSWKSTILVTATSRVQIKLICQDKNSTSNHNHKIKYSEVLNVSLIHVDVTQCGNYVIEVTNKKLANITILPNDEEIILLPFQTAIPSLVTKNACKMYQVPIQQKTLLKIVMYICQPGNAILGISHDKNHLLSKKYDRKFTIEGDRFTEVFEYAASPGILYFEVHSESDSIEYAIEVFPFYRQSEESKTRISLSDSYIETIPISSDKFKLKFEPYKISDPGVNYSVSYVVVESTQRHYLRKSLRCSTTFFDIQNPNTTFKQSYLKVEQELNGSMNAIYQPTYPHSYITIIPVVEPRPQDYTSRPSYDISELSIAKGPKFFEKSISILMGVIEALTGVQDENALNFILILVIVVTNVLIVSICCILVARHCRNTVILERKRLATNERQGRLGAENSLDMLDTKEDIEIQIKKEERKEEIP